MERRIAIHMDYRRHLHVVGALQLGINAKRPLLQAPEGPHRHAVMQLAVAALDADLLRQGQHVPDLLDPRAGADDDLVAADLALVGDDRLHRAAVVFFEAGDLGAGEDAHILVLGFLRQAIDRFGVVGVTALLLMQHGRDAFGLPIIEDRPHVFRAVGFALDEDRLVADLLLLLVDAGDVLMHHLGADLHVADRVIAEGLRIAFPDRHAMRHQAAHRRLEVVVAHHAASDTRRARADAALVHHQYVLAATLAGFPKVLRQVPGGAQAMNARADDQVFDMGRERHLIGPRGWTMPLAQNWLKSVLTGPANTLIISPAVFKPIFSQRHRNG